MQIQPDKLKEWSALRRDGLDGEVVAFATAWATRMQNECTTANPLALIPAQVARLACTTTAAAQPPSDHRIPAYALALILNFWLHAPQLRGYMEL